MSDSSGPNDESLESLVGKIVDEFLREQSEGKTPDVEEYASRYPAASVLLRQVLASLQLLDGSQRACQDDLDHCSVHPSQVLGDYRIVREIGRGGMGVVYEAEQISLGRRVALKILPTACALDSRRLQRFKNEARAAAGLHHSSIVPIYAIGCERGVHYFAMQFIEGRTLAAIMDDLRRHMGLFDEVPLQPSVSTDTSAGIAASSQHRVILTETEASQFVECPSEQNEQRAEEVFSLCRAAAFYDRTMPRKSDTTARRGTAAEYCRSITTLGMHAAEALDYAHQQGVVHRDVKPANLILDGDGKLWVADFGLARIQADVGVTLTGDVLGTLRYMSPEQILAKRGVVDERSDVYSLGATLYELLTLRPAFGGEDRHELLRQISDEDPVAPRKLNRNIPGDLETIVLKALEKSPSDRYHTAQELADDLQHFLRHEPIRARRHSLWGRVNKWSRRHRSVLTTAIGLAVLGILLGGLLLLREQARTRAALADAKAKSALVRQVVGDFFVEVTQDPSLLRDRPETAELRRKLLERAQTYYESLLAEDLSDPELRLEAALARCRLARISVGLRPSRETLALYDEGLAMLEQLPPEQISTPEMIRERADTYRSMGRLQMELGEFQYSLDSRLTALGLLRRLWHRNPQDVRLGTQVAGSYSDTGMMQFTVGDRAEAKESLSSALEIGKRLWREHPENLDVAHSLSNTYGNLANLHKENGRHDEAASMYQQALEILGPLVPSHPENDHLHADLAYHLREFGLLNAMRTEPHSSPDKALDYLNQSLEMFRRLSNKYPSRAGAAHDVAALQTRIAEILADHGRLDESKQNAQEAVSILDRISTEHPEVWDLAHSLAAALDVKARVCAKAGDRESALAHFKRAVTIREELWQRHPEIVDCGEGLAETLIHVAEFHQEAGRSKECLESVDRAIQLLDQLQGMPAPTAATNSLLDAARTVRERAVATKGPVAPADDRENGARFPSAAPE